MSHRRRSEILARVAQEIRISRGDLMGAALADGGKTLAESDPEVSEAVDFLEFYRRSATQLHRISNLRARGKGVVAVIPPWNFPIAIPCGGMAAALAAGNNVILKPASDAVLRFWWHTSCADASGARACRERRCSSCRVRERRSGRGW
jgi:RHH-type proline utilization regulon transcriptional repressor/proline dehydrogenase/delta 1-pyrroline-5-carboxylate dehydrogenase